MQKKESARAQANLAKTMMDKGQIQEAIVIYRKAITCSHPPASIYCQLGDALKKSGQLEEALTAYQQAIDLQPENAQFYLRQSQVYFNQKKIELAIEQAEVALQLNPDFVSALNQLVIIYVQRKELDKALSYRQRLVKVQPSNPNFFRQLMSTHSKILAQNKNIDEVIITYQKLLKYTQLDHRKIAHEYFGRTLLNLSIMRGQFDQAVTFFQEAIKTQSDSPWLYYNLGLSLAYQEQLDQAVSCYQKVIKLQPDFWQALIELARILHRKGDFDQAFQYFIKAIQHNPSLPHWYYSYCSPSSPDQWDLLQKTIQENVETTSQHNPMQYFGLGKNLSQQGKFSEAIVYYQKSIYHQLEKSKPEFVSRHWDNGKLREPNFLIIGVAKCGTTSLYNYVSQHPQFLPGIDKEPQYLSSLVSQIKRIEEQGKWSLLGAERDFYLAHFPPRPEGSQFFTGEASTTTVWSKSEKIVKNWFPSIKLIIILRNPVKRSISHYNQLLKNLSQKHSFEEVVTKELDELEQMTDLAQQIESLKYVSWRDHVAPGLYAYYLKRWMKLFSREQFLILSNEDLAQDPAGVMKQVFNFLGLPEYNGIDYTPRNVGSYPKDINPDLLSRLQDFYRPHNQKLEEFLGRKFNWD